MKVKTDRTRVHSGAHASTASNRRDEILEIAGNVFAERGFRSATVRDVADACNILSGSLYHHFASKEAMLLEILDRYVRELLADYTALAEAPGTSTDRFRLMIARAMNVVVERRPQLTIIHNDQSYLAQIEGFGDIQSMLDEVRAVWTRVIQQGIADGSFLPSVAPGMVYRTAMGTVLSAVRWFDPAGALTADEVAESIADIIMDGIGTARRKRRPTPDQ